MTPKATLFKKFNLLLLCLFLSLGIYAQQSISGTFNSNGQSRSYAGAVPGNPQASLRLVILFCGAGEDTTDMLARAYENHLGNNSMVVYPQPTDPAGFGNDATVDDFQMVEDLITDITANYSVNVNDICIGGFSNGAIFSYNLVCDFNASGSTRAYAFRSFAIVSGAMEDATANRTDCPVANAVPLIAFHGSQDPIINVNGGFLPPPVNLIYEALDTTMAFWAEDVNGCGANPAITQLPDIVTERPNSTVERRDYTCSSAPNTTFYYIQGAGHAWPGGNAALDIAQATNQDISASELIAAFFENNASISNAEFAQQPEAIAVYPNPVVDQLNLGSAYPVDKIEIFNTAGLPVGAYTGGHKSINLEQFETGIYYVKVYTAQGMEIKKIIKR